MAVLPDNAIAETEDGGVRQYQVVRIADEVVDLTRSACDIDYDAAMAGSIDVA